MDDIFGLVDVVEKSDLDVILYGPESSMDEMLDPDQYASFQRMYTEPGAIIHFDLSPRERPVLFLSSTMRTLLTKEQFHTTIEMLTNYILKNNYAMCNLFRSNINCEKYTVVDELNNLTLGIQSSMINMLALIVNTKTRDTRILNVDPNIVSFDPKYAINSEMFNLNNVCMIPAKIESKTPVWKDFGFLIVFIIIIAVIIGATFFLAFSYFTRHKK